MRNTVLALAAGAALLPAPTAAQPAQDQSLRTFLQHRFRADRGNAADARYVAAWADLNGDGRPEALVYLVSGYYCGTGGCDLLIFTPAGRSWRAVGDVSVSQLPIRLLPTRTRGWRDIAVRVAGGGIRGFDARLSFNGRAYPRNASDTPPLRARAAAAGRTLIADGDRGQPLF